MMLRAHRVALALPGRSTIGHVSLVARSTASLDTVHLRKLLEDASQERVELKREVSLLAKQSHDLAEQIETLANVIADQRGRLRTSSHAHVARTDFRPTRAQILEQPTHVSQIANLPLFELAERGSHSAHKERLIREIMEIDGVSWEEAHSRLQEMDIFNERHYWTRTMPYRVGILGAMFGAVAGTAMVFCKPIAHWYGVKVAGEDLPEGVEDISALTTNQVGSWTWTWMEPMIGVASFVLLCSQFARAQMWKLNMRPYTETMLRSRANRLADHYSQYDRGIVRQWAKHVPMVNAFSMPTYRHVLPSRIV